jgi:hypothetical protein
MARNSSEARIFFPWEHRGGYLRRLGLNRLRPFLLLGMLGLFTVLVGVRERKQSGERRTRALLTQYQRALDAHLAAHDDKCPKSLAAVRESAGLEEAPVDAWGRPLRFVCPGSLEGQAYQLSSDGADGVPGGLDRIE